MDRLTFRTELGVSIDKNEDCPTCSICWGCDIQAKDCEYLDNALEKLAKYEDMEENGFLLQLPCKVGSTVYLINTKNEVVPRTADMMFLGVLWDEYGKTWFLTQNEAEQKLKEAKSNNGNNPTKEL